MQNLERFGCQELSLTEAHDINGGLIDLGFLKIDLMNADGKINLGITIDPNALGSLPGGGNGGLGNILSPVTNLLNGLLGNLGGIVTPL